MQIQSAFCHLTICMKILAHLLYFPNNVSFLVGLVQVKKWALALWLRIGFFWKSLRCPRHICWASWVAPSPPTAGLSSCRSHFITGSVNLQFLRGKNGRQTLYNTGLWFFFLFFSHWTWGRAAPSWWSCSFSLLTATLGLFSQLELQQIPLYTGCKSVRLKVCIT